MFIGSGEEIGVNAHQSGMSHKGIGDKSGISVSDVGFTIDVINGSSDIVFHVLFLKILKIKSAGLTLGHTFVHGTDICRANRASNE